LKIVTNQSKSLFKSVSINKPHNHTFKKVTNEKKINQLYFTYYNLLEITGFH